MNYVAFYEGFQKYRKKLENFQICIVCGLDIYGNFRSTRSPDYDCFILISSKIWFEGVKENTYNSGDIVYSYNITLGGKELEVLNHLKINGLRKEKISTPLVIAILGSTQMLLPHAVNHKRLVASTCKHDKIKTKFSSTSN